MEKHPDKNKAGQGVPRPLSKFRYCDSGRAPLWKNTGQSKTFWIEHYGSNPGKINLTDGAFVVVLRTRNMEIG